MSEYTEGRLSAYRGCRELLERIEDLPADMQLRMVRAWLDTLIEKPLREIEYRARLA